MTNPKYGRDHRVIRAQLLPSAYGNRCVLCGRVMLPGQLLDLDHTPDGRGYRGFAHAHCNRSDGGRRGNRRRKMMKGTKMMMPLTVCALAVEIAEDRSATSVVAAGDDDGKIRVELAEYLPGSTVGVAAIVQLQQAREVDVVVLDPRSPAATLLKPLTDAGVKVTETSTHDVAVATGDFLDLLLAGDLRHDGSEKLTEAVRHITSRPLAGQVAVERRGHDVDVSPASAAVLAVWGWRHSREPDYDLLDSVG